MPSPRPCPCALLGASVALLGALWLVHYRSCGQEWQVKAPGKARILARGERASAPLPRRTCSLARAHLLPCPGTSASLPGRIFLPRALVNLLRRIVQSRAKPASLRWVSRYYAAQRRELNRPNRLFAGLSCSASRWVCRILRDLRPMTVLFWAVTARRGAVGCRFRPFSARLVRNSRRFREGPAREKEGARVS